MMALVVREYKQPKHTTNRPHLYFIEEHQLCLLAFNLLQMLMCQCPA